MTREEFIEGYMAHSTLARMAKAQRTPFGFEVGGDLGAWIALPCNCGYEHCHGWAMMPNSLSTVAIHCDLHLPPGHRALTFHMRCKRCAATWPMPYESSGHPLGGLIDKLTRHEIECPRCRSGDFINHLTVETYSEMEPQ